MLTAKYGYAKEYLRQKATPRAALGIDYTDDQTCIRRGLSAVGTLAYSCSVSLFPVFLNINETSNEQSLCQSRLHNCTCSGTIKIALAHRRHQCQCHEFGITSDFLNKVHSSLVQQFVSVRP
jgi:hypothetical protein